MQFITRPDPIVSIVHIRGQNATFNYLSYVMQATHQIFS